MYDYYYNFFSLPCEMLKLTLALGAAAGLVFLGSAGEGSLTGTVLSGAVHKQVKNSVTAQQELQTQLGLVMNLLFMQGISRCVKFYL